MSYTAKRNLSPSKYKDYGEMFDDIMASVKTDQLMIDTNTAPALKTDMYRAMLKGDVREMSKLVRGMSEIMFFRDIIIEYFKCVNESKAHPNALAFSFNHGKIYFWAEVKDDDEKAENALLKAEAIVNSKFYDTGLHISTTILEESDKVAVPSHYISVPLNDLTA